MTKGDVLCTSSKMIHVLGVYSFVYVLIRATTVDYFSVPA